MEPTRLTISDVQPMTTRLARVALLGLAGFTAECAVATANLPYTRYPILWATIFWVTSVSSVAAVIVWRPLIMQLCGAVTVTAFAMRAGMIAIAYESNLLIGNSDQQWTQLWQGVSNWLFHAFSWIIIFTRGLVPLVARTDRRRR